MIQPLGNWILIDPELEEENTSVFLKAEDVQDDVTKKGLVVEANKTYSYPTVHGLIEINIEVEKGDIVLFPKFTGKRCLLDGKEYFAIKNDDIMGIIKPDVLVD